VRTLDPGGPLWSPDSIVRGSMNLSNQENFLPELRSIYALAMTVDDIFDNCEKAKSKVIEFEPPLIEIA